MSSIYTNHIFVKFWRCEEIFFIDLVADVKNPRFMRENGGFIGARNFYSSELIREGLWNFLCNK